MHGSAAGAPSAGPGTGAAEPVGVDAVAPPQAAEDPDGWAAGLQHLLRGRLERSGVGALLPLPGGPDDERLRVAAQTSTRPAALLLPTSGSTGDPRLVEVGAAALLASARGSDEHLGGRAHWLLALPLGHVAGWNVLARGVVAGTPVTALPPGRPFAASALAAGLARLLERAGDGPARTALVPTQLARALDDEDARGALARLDAVLLGGAAASPSLLRRAREAGVRVVTTYGATETCGGCVYDGVPLPGVGVRLDGDRVLLGGPVVALGLAGGPGPQVDDDGVAWVRTDDAGRWEDDTSAPGGRRLRVLGRLDDVVVTGGEKVAPAAVEAVLAAVDGVGEVLVVGVPDERWGQAVTALVVPAASGAPSLEALRSAARGALGRASAPQHLVVVDALPARALGKPDRRAAAALAARRLPAAPCSSPDV
ncbi:AMP-binding protein [Pseudokineococcus sp. 1T1Z-3]|uniref:AMP-binding protein n=1 Tax=Pseudokineococcus sp. 1T1Z-3 TaxID=3132745 RepID=UPI0030AA8ABA